ncbi:hypothetical protein LG291_13860 [Cytobacillus firmus]|uniref:hypothetical protein n=1 Tax=Cytobacillus firmus TaxID=1399 RepID=UPI00384CCBAA
MGKLLPNIIKVGKWLFVLFLLVACENEKSSNLAESNPMNKHQLESLLKKKIMMKSVILLNRTQKTMRKSHLLIMP